MTHELFLSVTTAGGDVRGTQRVINGAEKYDLVLRFFLESRRLYYKYMLFILLDIYYIYIYIYIIIIIIYYYFIINNKIKIKKKSFLFF